MISTDSLTLIRMITFGIAVVICAAYACAATLGIPPEALPHWAPITAGAVAAAVVFGVSLLANASATIAAFDESYRADRRTAAFAGFWGGIISGTLLWLTQAGGDLQLAITLTSAAAVFLLVQSALDLLGRR